MRCRQHNPRRCVIFAEGNRCVLKCDRPHAYTPADLLTPHRDRTLVVWRRLYCQVESNSKAGFNLKPDNPKQYVNVNVVYDFELTTKKTWRHLHNFRVTLVAFTYVLSWIRDRIMPEIEIFFKVLTFFRFNMLCAWRHNMTPPLSSPVGAQSFHSPPSRRNVAVLSHAEYVSTLTAAAALRVKAALSKLAAWWSWPFDLESGVRVTWATGCLCANFSFLGLSVFELGPMYVTDRQTDVRQKTSLNGPAY